MYDLCVFTCIIFIFVFRCTHVRMSYVLNSYLLTYLTQNVKQYIQDWCEMWILSMWITQNVKQTLCLVGDSSCRPLRSSPVVKYW